MTFEDFKHLARLYIVGALDDDEMARFRSGRKLFGKSAEDFINECRKLNAAFALSLQPAQPNPATKEKLLAKIRDAAIQRNGSPDIESSRSISPVQRFAFGNRGGVSRI